MLKLLFYELKRLFNNRSSLLSAVVCPLIVLYVLSGSLIPGLFSHRQLEGVTISVLNETKADEVDMLLRNLTSAESVDSFLKIDYVTDIDGGLEAIKTRKSVAFVHIPEALHDEMTSGGKGEIIYYDGNTGRPASFLIYSILDSGLTGINKAQEAAETVFSGMRELGYSYSEAADEFNGLAMNVFSRALNRSEVFDERRVSPFGNLLGIEYYSISVIIIFALLASTILASTMSHDVNSEMLARGLPAGNNAVFLLAKFVSGTIFIFVVSAPASLSALWFSGTISGPGSDIPGTLASAIILSMYCSGIMLAIGGLAVRYKTAIWPAFTFVFLVSVLSGLIVPYELMPQFIKRAAEATGVPAIARMFSITMFGSRSSVFIINMLIVCVIVLLALIAAYAKIAKRSPA